MLNCSYLVIGAGQTGLTIAHGLSEMGKDVILVEQSDLGGTYLFSQEIPKYFLSSVSRDFASSLKLFKNNEQTFNTLRSFRQSVGSNVVNKIKIHKNNLLEKIVNNENIRILKGVAEFTSKSLAEVNSDTERHLVNFENAVIATGKNTLVTPDISGIEEVPFIHQHNIFLFPYVPNHLGLIGLTPGNLEIANIYANLGVKVTLFEEKDSIVALKKLDRSGFNYIIKQLLAKQVDFQFKKKIVKVLESKSGGVIVIDQNSVEFKLSHLHIHAQESFSDEELKLNKLGLNWTPSGVITNANGQTQQKNVWAFGECSNQVTKQNKHSQVFDFLDKIKNSNPENSRSQIANPLIPLQLSSVYIETIKTSVCKVEADKGVVTVGFTETESNARFGRDIEIEVIDSAIIDGFAKLVIKSGSKQIVGVTLAGDFCDKLEYLTVKLFQKTVMYSDYRNYLKALLGI